MEERNLLAIQEKSKCYYITSKTKYQIPFFLVELFRDAFIRGIQYFKNTYKFNILGYVLMPDHFHLLIMPFPRDNISSIMRDIKSYSGREIARILGDKGKVWEDGFTQIVVEKKRDFRKILNEIHNDPVKSGIVSAPGDYPFSSYRFYVRCERGPIEIDAFE